MAALSTAKMLKNVYKNKKHNKAGDMAFVVFFLCIAGLSMGLSTERKDSRDMVIKTRKDD